MKMLNTEKLNAIITEDFEFLADLIESAQEYGIDDEDIEKIMKRHDLESKEAIKILDTMKVARREANITAIKAANDGANAAIDSLGGIELDENEYYKNPARAKLWDEIWRQIHAEVMKVEYKALAKI